jgi:hypothetical protein
MKRVILALASVALLGCMVNLDREDRGSGPAERENRSIELDKSEMARVELKMGVGELDVEGGSPKLMDAAFEYNRPRWKPIVTYDSSSFRSKLTIEEPSGIHGGSHSKYRWDLRFNDKLPMDFVTHLGVGDARLNLGSLTLRSVEVHMGVGQLHLDLRGKPERDYSVEIHGGVGHAVVYLPRDVGIVANASGGIGDIQVSGLEKHNGQWISPGREHSPVTIHVEVHGGVGQIQLIAD